MYKIGLILKAVNKDVINKSLVRSTNRAAVTVRAEAARAMRTRYNLPINGSSKGGGGNTPPGLKNNILIQKSKGGKAKGIGDIVAIIRVADSPVSMIHFVKGEKKPAPQKGIPISKRRVLRVAITRGNTKPLPKAFILKANGSVQVYRMVGGIRKKQSVPSLWKLLRKPELHKPLEELGSMRFAQEMERNIAYYSSKVKV